MRRRLLCGTFVISCCSYLVSGALLAVPRGDVPADGKAPAPRNLAAAKTVQVPACQSLVYVLERDGLILRRGAKILQRSLRAPYAETLLAEEDAFEDRELVRVFVAGERLFIVLNELSGPASTGRTPLVYDVDRKKIISLDPGDVKIPKGRRFEVTDLDFSPNRHGVLLRLSGGGSTGINPRQGQRPAWCWINLRDGTIQHLPAEWHPFYASAAGATMVFTDTKRSGLEGRVVVAFDLERGAKVDPPAKGQEGLFSHYSWGHRGDGYGLVSQSPLGERHLAGVRLAGKDYVLPFPKGLLYAQEVQATRKFAAAHVRSNAGKYDEGLWLGPLDGKSPPRQVATDLHQFVLFGEGQCVFDAFQDLPNKSRTTAAFFHDYQTRQTWDLRDGAAGLPPVAETDPPYYHDRFEAKFTPALGTSDQSRWALARLHHVRSDGRARGPFLPRQEWSRQMLISPAGIRYFVDLPHKADCFFHPDGTVVVQTPSAHEAANLDQRQVRYDLRLLHFDLPR